MSQGLPQPAPPSPVGRLGKVLLLSSGETATSGRRMHERLFAELGTPIRVAILETPAGFELNSALVAQRVGDYLKTSLRNFSPAIAIIPARRRGGPFSTDDPALLAPMLEANYLFLGAGSPTYLVRHLKDSLALSYLLGRHRVGAALCLASAAAIAFGSKTLPVYEIFKAGHDLHWIDGLDLFGPFGLDLAIVTHWDNREGGANLDTSCCFMGRSRMEQLRRLLPPTTVVLGIDEHTGVVFDFQAAQCQVMGKGGVSVLAPDFTEVYGAGATFPMQRLGPYHPSAAVPGYGPPVGEGRERQGEVKPPQDVVELVQKREAARRAGNWLEADAIRQQLAEMGFEVQDTREGPRLRRKELDWGG